MSEKNWTPEPWSVDEDGRIIWGPDGPGHGSPASADPHFTIPPGPHLEGMKANAARIVATVNGCASIPNPDGLGGLVDLCKAIANRDPIPGYIIPTQMAALLRACGIEVD